MGKTTEGGVRELPEFCGEPVTFTTTMFGGILYFTKDRIWFHGTDEDFQRIKGRIGD